MNILATLLLTHQHQKMKKISLLLVALVAVFCVSCSNDPKVEGEFVKAVDEAIAQFENAKTMDDLTAFAQKIEEISNNEAFGNLKETGAAKEASERLEKCVDGMDKKAEEITANMLNSITGEDAEETEDADEAEEPAEE
jgi:PBP1b-binding outer membrane lipoprotein LpoB